MPFTTRAHIQRNPQLARTMTLGYHPETYDEFLVPEVDRYAGTYIMGTQGYGKSGLIENMALQDIEAGKAVVLIDPHGDLVDNCVAGMSPQAAERTYVLDMLDEDFPFGVNVFAGDPPKNGAEASARIGHVWSIFDVLWEDVLTQAYLPRYLRSALIVLLANPGTTLVDMRRFLREDNYRARLLANVTDADVRDFWETEYNNLSHEQRNQKVGPLIGRLETLFLGRPLVRNIMGQRKTSINFREAIERRDVVLIKLPIKKLNEDARLVGTILISQLHAAIFSFSDIPEAQRPGVSLYVDEFQNFTTPAFSELFSEGRKFGARVSIAHQYRSQLPGFLRESTTTARTVICFHVKPEDSHEMAPFFPSNDSTVKPEDIDPRPVENLLTFGSDDPYVREFIDIYLRPLQVHRRGNKVDIQDKQWSWSLWNGTERKQFYVSDPTPYLNNLLFEVMRTGDYGLPIPGEVAVGFANEGRGFFTEARHTWNNHMLEPGIQFPIHLVSVTDGYPRWNRRPENAKEQYYHFVFCLRQVMAYLAANPLGKVTQTTAAETGQMLTQLPKRAAFVRSADDVGVIFTHDTPSKLAGHNLAERQTTIRDQTRRTYCHPKADVERAIEHGTDLTDNPPPEDSSQDERPDQDTPLPDEDHEPPNRWE